MIELSQIQIQKLKVYIKKNSYEDTIKKFGISRWHIYSTLKQHKGLKLGNKTLDEYKTVYTDFWACGRTMGQYRGIYPIGMMNKLANLINFDGKQILHLFSGITQQTQNQHTLDINQKVKPTFLADATQPLPIKNNKYDITIADPPYNTENGKDYSKELYGLKAVKPYSFVKEAVRITKPNGYLCILHHLSYIKPKGTIRKAVIGITTGPNMRIRILNIFKKE